MNRITSALFPLALGLILCSGCMTYSLYDGAPRPEGELGIIKLCVIRDIDGVNLQYLTGHDISVLPGPHSLGLTPDRRKPDADSHTFDIILEAGHVYEGVVGRDKSGSGKPPVIYVMDRTTGAVVARHPALRSASSKKTGPAPEPKVLAATKSSTRPAKPIDPQTLEKLRQLRQMKIDGLITQEEYVRKGNALIGKL